MSGWSAATFGYGVHFALCAGLTAVGAALVAWRVQPNVADYSAPAPTGSWENSQT